MIIDYSGLSQKFMDKMMRLVKQIDTRNPIKKFEFTYNEEPVSDVRPRKGRHGFYDPRSKEKKKMEKFLKKLIEERDTEYILPLAGKKAPIEDLHVIFYLKPPKSISNSKTKNFLAEQGFIKPVTRPDSDNYLKFLMDVGNDVLWYDDSQCFNIKVEKRYSDKQPRTECYMAYREDKIDFRILNS